MIIYFNPKTYNFLKTYVIKPGNIELEVRFGKYENGRYKPDIGLETFNKIKDFLSTNPNITNIIEEESKSEILPHHIRRITYSNSEKNIPQLRGVVKYEQKNKIYTDDIEYKDFVLRIAESEERPIQPYPAQAIEVRERERTMYFHNSGAFYFVLTKVQSLSEQESKITYELEIEYVLRPELVSYFPDIFKDSISLLLSVLIFSEYNVDKFRYGYLPLDEENRIRDLYRSLYIKEPKPVNLSRQITPKLFSMGYTVTNKLDGERFILLFTEYGLYAFNNRKVEKYDDRNYGRITVMDSEAFEGVYYIFDCMVYNGENITDQSHDDRLSMASELLDNIGPTDFLKMKMFFRTPYFEDKKLSLKHATKDLLETICPSEDMKDLIKRIKKPTLWPENNDGLVYTSSGKYNSPVYKWKIPEKMSIDFAVYRINKSPIYELYVKDNIDGEPVNVPFRGNATYELEQAVYESDVELKEGGIYEFGYDNSTNKFVLFRPRLDKIDPNFITVAENVWSDIKNPYTKEELLELLSPIVLEEYREYQNGIKRGLIDKYCKEKAVLDLGSGRGGDLGKYDSAKVSHLWCIEPNPKNYTELLRRLSERKEMKRKTTLIKTVAQDTETIVNGIKDTLSYTYPIVFNSIVTYKSYRENISYTSLDNLRNKVSWGFDIDRNSFVILDYNDQVITEDELYNTDPSDRILHQLRVFETTDEDDIKKQEFGGDFRNWFPKKYGVDYSKLKITDEGMYSLTKHSDSLAIIKAMKNIMGEENLGGLTILDGTANVGGDTIRFGMNFNKVISVELNKENYDILKNNVEVFELESKVETINGDITKVWNDVQPFTDVLFLDPPWGGKDYMGDDEEVLNLFLSGISISEFVGKVLMSPCRPSYIFIKLPVNYDINSFIHMPYVSDIQIFTIRKFYLVCLTVDDRQMPTKKADILSSFFSLSFFFFKNDLGEYKDLNNLVNTIDQTLKNDGYFIGTTIDGNKTRELLNSFPDKKFDFNGGYIRFVEEEKEIVELLIRDTIVETQIESLVDFELLEAKLLERDIVLHDSEIFNPGPLSDKENILNSLYRYFVFKRKSKEDVYTDKVKQLIQEKSRPVIQSVKNGKRELTSDEILKTLTLCDMKEETNSLRSLLQCRDENFFQLLDLKDNLVGDYKLLSFNYIAHRELEGNERPEYLITKYYEDQQRINYLKEYYNSRFNYQNMFQITGLIDNSPLYHVKSHSNIIPFNEIFKYDQNIITSCIYQLYFIMMYLKSNLQFSAPQIVLAKDESITSIKYGDKEIQVFNGVFIKLLNSSYTIDKNENLELQLNIQPPLIYDYNGLELLHYLDKHYKLGVLYNLDSCNIPEYSNFLLKFLTIETSYNNIEDDEVNIIDSNPYNSYAHNDFSLSSDLYIKQQLDLREKQINDLSDSQYEYYEKFSKIFKKIDSERSKNKVSNKITKWMEVLSRYMLYVDREKRYKVLSTGYMPQMFLYALRSITDLDFDWYAIDIAGDAGSEIHRIDTYSEENIEQNVRSKFSKCKNWMHMDTTSSKVINHIDKKMNEKIDIYASYMNKDEKLNPEEEKEKFLADILTGLVSLRQDGMLLVNVKSFFTVFETSLLGYVSDMFKEFYIYKPISSDMLISEVFIVGRGYNRNEEKINYLKTNRINVYVNSLNMLKYSNILLAAYKLYGRQMYFMDKDMECYRYLSEKYSIDELSEDLLRKNSNKMVRYYLKMRKSIQKQINKTTDSFNFNVKKWDNYGCLSPAKLALSHGATISELGKSKAKKLTKNVGDDYKRHDGDWSSDTGSPVNDISDELYEEHKENIVADVYKDVQVSDLKRCTGQDVFKNIVRMTNKVNKLSSIKSVIRRKLNFNKISNLIRSPYCSTLKIMPVGVELIQRHELSQSHLPYIYIFIYKPEEGLYRLVIHIKKLSNRNFYNTFEFRYVTEPKPETLIDWILDIVSNIINDLFIDDKQVENFFKNIRDKKDIAEKGLDVLLNWYFDPAYGILL
jgi:predicted RNA methylase